MCAKKTQIDRNFVKKDEILIERTVAEQDKKEKIDEEDEIKFERAERMFTNAVLKDGKEEIKKDNLVVNSLKKEYFRFFIGILIVLGLAYCAFNFTTIFVMKKTKSLENISTIAKRNSLDIHMPNKSFFSEVFRSDKIIKKEELIGFSGDRSECSKFKLLIPSGSQWFFHAG